MQLEYTRVLHESLLVPVLTYGSETMIWRKKERSSIRVVQMDNLRSAGYQEKGSIHECTDETVVWMKRLMKVFSDGLGMCKEWRMTVLLRGPM